MMDLFLSAGTASPEQRTIDELFHECAAIGVNPELIQQLQNVASRESFCCEQRANLHSRKQRNSNQEFLHYVVSFVEPERMTEVDKRRTQHAVKLQSKNQVKVFAAILHDQRWINNLFMDSVESHMKLVAHYFLTLSNVESTLRPDQTTINDAFAHMVRKGHLSMAIMLSEGLCGRRTVDQQGFDQAFDIAVRSDNADLIEFLLNGRSGMVPSPQVVDEVYKERCRRLDREPRRPGIFGGLFNGQDDRVRLNLNDLRMMGRSRRRQGDLDESAAAAQRVSALLDTRVSAEAAAEITREREVATRRRRHFAQMHRDSAFVGDIHAYSGARINEPDGAQRLLDDGEEDGMEVGEGELDDAMPRNPVNPGDAAAAENDNANGEDGGEDEDDDEDDVPPPEAAPAAGARPAASRSLHEAVLDCIARRVQDSALSLDQISNRMSALITSTFPSAEEQTRAMRIVAEGMNARNERILGLTLNFLTSGAFPPSAQALWLQGFLVESIAVNSCNPGAMERIVTGLRGVDDPELNAIFRLAEGPNLARIFLMGTFNVYFSEHVAGSRETATRNAQHLARVLVQRGATAQTTAEEAEALLMAYAREAIESYGVGNMDATIGPVVQSVADGYEDYVQPHVLLELSRSASDSDIAGS